MIELSLQQNGLEVGESENDDALALSAIHDRTAFATLYRRYVARIYRYLYSRLGEAAEAEDCTAQVFTETLQGLSGYRPQGQFAAWLFSIARRRAADFHRRGPQPLELDDEAFAIQEQGDVLAQVIQHETLDKLGKLIHQQPKNDQELLRLRFAAGLSYAEIGVVLRRSEGAIKMAMSRCLHRMKNQWEERDE